MRVCLVYDCLYPYTVGGGERWYRNLAEALEANGHEVTYLTLRQWDRGEQPVVGANVRVVAVGPRLQLYVGGRRRIGPPLVFGLGVLWHLLHHGRRYDVVHTAAFPYFSLLAAALVRPLRGFSVVVDWFEVWSRAYWRDYLGPVGGRIGELVQRACARVRQHAFCLSELHAARLREQGLRGDVTVLRGLYTGSTSPPAVRQVEPLVMFAGRLIPEKRVALAVAGVVLAARSVDGLRGVFFGDGPERTALESAIAQAHAAEAIEAPGFVPGARIDEAFAQAMCLLVTSRREGYGLVVVEAAARSTPSIVVAGLDNAATELIEDGINGFVVRSPDAESIAAAIVRVHAAGSEMRRSTSAWFAANAPMLTLESSLATVLDAYNTSRPG